MNAAGYVRVSTDTQAEKGYSIGEQTERIRAYCAAMGWTIFRIYTDGGFSGSNMERPALREMIRDAEAGMFGKVVVYKLDRLSRSQKDTLTLIEDVFLPHGIDFVSMSESFDTSSPFGRASLGMMATFAQLEREQIKERMQMGRYARIKAGKYKGNGIPPLGYTYRDGFLVTEPFEAEQVRLAFSRFIAGDTPEEIARELNRTGMTHQHGEWTARMVRKALRSRTYIGMVHYRGEWFPGLHEALVSPEDWDKAQRIMERRHELYAYKGEHAGRVVSYLGGLIYCAHCGGKYSYHGNREGKRIYRFYKCNSRAKKKGVRVWAPDCRNKIWKADELEGLVFGEIKKLAMDPGRIRKAGKKEDRREKAISDKVVKIDRELSRLIDLYSVDGIPVGTLQAKIREAQERREKLEEELTRLRDQAAPVTTPEEAEEAVRTFADVLGGGDFREIRRVVEALISRIEIDGDDLTIYWTFSPKNV